MKFSELITKLHSASQPHMLMYIDIRSDCELVDVNILASGQSDVQAGTLYFADAGQLTPYCRPTCCTTARCRRSWRTD